MIRRYLPLLLAVLFMGCSSLDSGGTGRSHEAATTPPSGPVEPTVSQPTTHSYPQTINGITFQAEPGGLGCTEPLQDATDAQIASSPLNFSLSYLPAGYVLSLSMASTCQGRVVSLGKIYVGPAGAINVARWTKRTAPIPDDIPVPTEISGRAAVAFGRTVIIAEPFGMTAIQVDGLNRQETLRIAAGLR